MILLLIYSELSCNICRLQNYTEKEAETPPIDSLTTTESLLCKKLQQLEDQLKEILANNVISKKQTVNIPNIKKIDSDKIGEQNLGKKNTFMMENIIFFISKIYYYRKESRVDHI